MKRFLLLTALVLSFSVLYSNAQDKQDAKKDKGMWESLIQVDQFWGSTFPQPFNAFGQERSPEGTAVSTGYYFIDNESELSDWAGSGIDTSVVSDMIPNFDYIFPTFEPNTWTKIVPGPNMVKKSYWTSPENKDGFYYFRNPQNMNDSTDNAFAGPMPLGIVGGFYFYGIRYDSFYVSTNGGIFMSNRRYFYDVNGQRAIPEGESTAYDPMSMDWFEWARSRDTLIDPQTRQYVRDANGNVLMANGLMDFTPDDYGYTHMMDGMQPVRPMQNGDLPDERSGLKGPAPGSLTGIRAWNKGAVIAPLWGEGELSQYNKYTKKTDGFSSVWFKRSITGDSLVIHFDNYLIKGDARYGTMGVSPDDTREVDENGNYTYKILIAAFQVILDGSDSSVTIHYRKMGNRFDKNSGYAPTIIFRSSTLSGVRGISRHVSYGKNPQKRAGMEPKPFFAPWAGDYRTPGEEIQYTKYWGKESQTYRGGGFPPGYSEADPTFSVKFKQWKNVVRSVGLEYRVRGTNPEVVNPAEYLQFTETVNADQINNYELLAGEERIGAIQPVAFFQNLTNEIQGPNGVNFTPQGLEFSARMQIVNTVTARYVYNRFVPIDDNCLSLQGDWQECTGDPTVRVKLLTSLAQNGQDLTPNPEGPDAMTQYNSLYANRGLHGVYPYKFVVVYFPPYEPNQFIPNHIGKMLVILSAVPESRDGRTYGDKWPFDDVAGGANLWVMKRLDGFNWDGGSDNSNVEGRDFHFDLTVGATIPNVLKMKSVDAAVIDGDLDGVSRHPLPPRGAFGSINNPSIVLNSPMISLDAAAINSSSRKQDPAGDQLESFPIDLRDEFGATLTLSVQRARFPETGFATNWPSTNSLSLYGPEPRITYRGNPLTVFTGQIPNSGGRIATNGENTIDQLVVEFAKPSDDGLNRITNLKPADWNHHPYPNNEAYKDVAALEEIPALRIYGGGGYFRGWSESNPNLPLELPTANQFNGLRPDDNDPGLDYKFRKYFVQIPDTFIRWQNEGAKNFRFRIQTLTWNNKINAMSSQNVSDDLDEFLVDNIAIISALEEPELEVSAVSVRWPYTQVPPTQAEAVPLTVSLSNNSSLSAPIFSVKVQVHRLMQQGFDKVVEPEPVYCRSINVPNLSGGSSIDVSMPSWNARKVQKSRSEEYRIVAMLNTPTKDPLPFNDTTYYDFTLTIGESYAYDPTEKNLQTNDVPTLLGHSNYQASGYGLNFPVGQNGSMTPGNTGLYKRNTNGANGNFALYDDGTNQNVYYGWHFEKDFVGDRNKKTSGRMAVRFEVYTTDTLRGFQAFFANANAAPSDILFEVYKGGQSSPSVDDSRRVASMMAKRATDLDGELKLDQYISYKLDNPVEVVRGYYWIMITQLDQSGLELGASSYKMGMRTTNVMYEPNSGALGMAGTKQFLLEPNFRRPDGLNDNFFALQNVYGKGNWWQFSSTGNPLPLSWTDHLGTLYPHDYDPMTGSGPTISLGRGTWIPMFRPYFGEVTEGSYGSDIDFHQWCPEDIPVEIFTFEGSARATGIDLYWETASEENNREFMVERRLKGEADVDWKEITSVPGKGNSNTIQRYNYTDAGVLPGNTYQYKLTQVDFDGTTSCASSEIVEVKFDMTGEVLLGRNAPNPVTHATTFNFTLPTAEENVRLEVIDAYGKVVATIADGSFGAGSHEIYWEANSFAGSKLPAGAYIIKLTAGDVIKSGKMTVIR